MSEESNAERVNSVERGERRVLIASLVSMAAIVIAMVVVVIQANQRDDEREQDRVDRAVESCLQYNRDQTRQREFANEQIRAVFVIFSGATPEELDGAKGELAEYEAFVKDQHPYRQCSPVCVDAYFNDAVADCGPALDEAGHSP